MKYINNFRTNNADFNVISIGGPNFQTGKFKITAKDFNTFLKKYVKFVFSQKQKCYLLEPPFNNLNKPHFQESIEYMNLLKIDIDIKTTYDDNKTKRRADKA